MLWRFAVIQFFASVGLKLWDVVGPVFKRCLWCALFMFTVCVTAILLSMFLTGCAALPAIGNTIAGEAPSKYEDGPIYQYRADLTVGFDGQWFDGTGVTISAVKDIAVSSIINIDRVEIQSCARLDVCEFGKKCNDTTFKIDSGWFGKPGNTMTYHYIPGETELGESCPIHIKVFDKEVLAAWAFIAFRNGEELPATFTCNGVNWKFAGHSVCQTKKGLIQKITFAEPPEDFDADKECNMVQLADKRSFEIRPALGLCTGKFYYKGKWHGMDVIGYNGVVIR